MPFNIDPTNLETDEFSLTESGSDLVLTHKATGATFSYDSAAGSWRAAEGLTLGGALDAAGNDVGGVNSLSTDELLRTVVVHPEDGAAGINAAVASNTVIVLEAGEYVCNETITVPTGTDHLHIVGRGSGTTTLTGSIDGDVIEWTNSHNGGIYGITVDGDKANTASGNCITFGEHTSFLTIKDVHINNANGHGILVDGGYNLSFEQVYSGLAFSGNPVDQDVFHVKVSSGGIGPSRLEFYGCYAYNQGGYGWRMKGQSISLYGCEANKGSSPGVFLFGCSGVDIHGMDVEKCPEGIVLGDESTPFSNFCEAIGIFGGNMFDLTNEAVRAEAVIGLTVANVNLDNTNAFLYSGSDNAKGIFTIGNRLNGASFSGSGQVSKLEFGTNSFYEHFGTAESSNLAGTTGTYDGQLKRDDGTNTSGTMSYCEWDETNSQWVRSDGTTFT